MLPVVKIEAGSRPVVAGVVDDGVAAGDGLEVAARLFPKRALQNTPVADHSDKDLYCFSGSCTKFT